jgi:uncharacterized protein YycO
MANKVTKVERINALISTYGIEGEDKDFLLHEIELINKRNSYKSDKPTKAQKENATRKEGILAVMEEGKAYTATDVATAMGDGWSPQRASALLKQMKEAGVVVKAEVKRRSYFALAGTDIEAVLATAEASTEAE